MVEPIINFGIRDWPLEMGQHARLIQEAIDADQHDAAWRRIHEFQDWCIERINTENRGMPYAGTLLSAPQKFFVRILKKEKKHKQALIHTIYQAALDARELKFYPKEIAKCFRKCKFSNTSPDIAISLYESSKGSADLRPIRDEVATWQ